VRVAVSIMAEPITDATDVGLGEPYRVRLGVYEGPMELLLFLVRRNELDICDVPIAAVTDQYLEFLVLMELLNIDVAGEYIVVASQLLLIKSRRLLPVRDQDGEDADDEAEDGEDPRVELERRLAEYRRFRDSATVLKEHMERQSRRFPRAWGDDEEHASQAVSVESVSIFDIVAAFKEILASAKPEKPTVLKRQTLTVGRRMQEIEALVRAAVDGLSFRATVSAEPTRMEVIVTFLAILELIRRRRVAVEQEELMGEIRLYPGSALADTGGAGARGPAAGEAGN
jgi:segregation and condensation protein A